MYSLMASRDALRKWRVSAEETVHLPLKSYLGCLVCGLAAWSGVGNSGL